MHSSKKWCPTVRNNLSLWPSKSRLILSLRVLLSQTLVLIWPVSTRLHSYHISRRSRSYSRRTITRVSRASECSMTSLLRILSKESRPSSLSLCPNLSRSWPRTQTKSWALISRASRLNLIQDRRACHSLLQKTMTLHRASRRINRMREQLRMKENDRSQSAWRVIISTGNCYSRARKRSPDIHLKSIQLQKNKSCPSGHATWTMKTRGAAAMQLLVKEVDVSFSEMNNRISYSIYNYQT